MLKYTIAVASCLALATACMKDTNFHCDYQQLGNAHLTFNSAEASHHIHVVYPDASVRKKLAPAGMLTDTLILKSDAYELVIYALHEGDTMKTHQYPVSITSCEETKIVVDR